MKEILKAKVWRNRYDLTVTPGYPETGKVRVKIRVVGQALKSGCEKM